MTLLEFVFAVMLLLAPGRDHAELGAAIVQVVGEERPLFADDTAKRRTAAIIVAVAFRESSLRTNIIGDHGRSFCAMQIHETSGGTSALLTDPLACVRKGFAMLRTSLHECPSAPIAWYAAGPTGCSSARARGISLDRMNLAARLVRDVKGTP